MQYKRHPLGLAKLAPHLSPEAVDLMHRMLIYDPGAYMLRATDWLIYDPGALSSQQ